MINLVLGDCLEKMKDIPDKSIDSIITDPPYGTTACKWDSVIPFDLMWEQLNRIIKPNGAIVLFGSEPFSSALRMSNIKNYKYDWKWKKTKAVGFQHSKNKPMKIMEDLIVFSFAPMGHASQLGDRRMVYIPQGIIPTKEKTVSIAWHGNMMGARLNQVGKKYLAYTNFPNELLEYNQPIGKKSIHPTQKPVELLEYLIKTYTLENETVLDFTMGSGTTGVACKNLNRNFIGIEKDENYFKIAQERINNYE
jgi:site-specific DNA-methyltransferase (adenine-specific)